MTRKISIRTIWNGFILFVVLFPVIVLLPWLATKLYAMQLESYLATQKQFNLTVKDHVGLEVKRLVTLLRNKSDPMAYTLTRGVDKALLRELLKVVLSREPAVHSLHVVSRSGQLLARLDQNWILQKVPTGGSPADVEHSFQVNPGSPEIDIPLRGRVFFGPLEPHGDAWQFPIAVPIGSGSRPAGVLVAKIAPQKLWEGVYPHIGRPEVLTYIVDNHGRLVVASSGEEQRIGTPATHLPIISELLKGKDWDSRKTYTGFTGARSFGVATKISSLDWGIISEIPKQLVTKPIYNLLFIIVGVSLAVALLAGGGGLVSVGRLLKPINQLTQAFARAGKGDYAQQMPPSSVREFSQLSDRFSSMLKEISAYQHKMHESEKHFRELVETANTIPWRLDLDTWRFTYVGPQAVELLGYPVEDWYAENFWPDHLHQDDREWAARFCQESTARNEDHEFEYRMLAADGRIVWVRDSVNVVSGEGGPKMLRGFMFDITSRKQAEEELQKHRDHLEELVAERTAELEMANRELEAFSYSVSHDLRSPLRGIDGFSLALLEDYKDKLDDTGKDHLQRVRAASQRMGELIDDLLMLSQVSRAEMHRETVDLSALAHEITARLKEDRPDRQLEFSLQEGLTASGDANLLRIVLENLLDNACKFTGKEPIARIEFGYTNKDGQGVYYVRDNGVGFDMKYSHKLFGAFQRLHASTEFEGTGIGLVTVTRIVHRHGGQVWAEAEKDIGATFYFTLGQPAD